MNVRVGLNPVFAFLFFGCALLNFTAYSMSHDGLQAALGAMMSVIGVMYLFGTAFVVDGHAVLVKNPLGMTLRTYPYESPHDLSLQGRTLWIQTTGGDRKKCGGITANGTHLRDLAKAIAAAQAASPRANA